ncbi:TOPRIM nucleotidyl transferase/hydrolase domain-containing protein [Streptomyces sp. NPDC006670]|uniref:TOPRIM nucleotidyl transferase/hydrolase domain-containing protein n=1 Tax=Streptomyces sp. NPDC006670 TaxID=3154476 RepID=UPI0033C188FE
MADIGEFREAVARAVAGGDGSGLAEAARGVRGVVLVEGPSDLAALEALTGRLGRDLAAEGVCVLSMGGAMNVGRHAGLLGPPGLGLRLTGLCDERERPFYDRALERAGASGREVFVCVKDLEEELIRALGVGRVEEIVEAEGELTPWRTFTRQPAQRGRSPQDRMRRFLGTKKGRKIRYGGLLAGALDPALLPGPLDALLGRL